MTCTAMTSSFITVLSGSLTLSILRIISFVLPFLRRSLMTFTYRLVTVVFQPRSAINLPRARILLLTPRLKTQTCNHFADTYAPLSLLIPTLATGGASADIAIISPSLLSLPPPPSPAVQLSRTIEFYKFPVPDPKGRSTVVVDIVYNHAAVPVPHVISQTETQKMQVHSNLYMPSPYATKKQKLKIRCVCSFCAFPILVTNITWNHRYHSMPSANIESYTNTRNPVSKSGKSINYGPYDTKVDAFAFEPVTVHGEDNDNVLTVVSLSRELWLSHWGGTMQVEEWYQVRHDGAK